jgi:ankyrin repeat protein
LFFFSYHQRLIEEIDNINHIDSNSSTALHYAVMSGRIEICELLIDDICQKNLSMDLKDNLGFTPLHWAAATKNETVVHILIENGVNVNATDLQNETPLFLATRNSDLAIVKVLLDSGASKQIK